MSEFAKGKKEHEGEGEEKKDKFTCRMSRYNAWGGRCRRGRKRRRKEG